jgi:hypothetical protein
MPDDRLLTKEELETYLENKGIDVRLPSKQEFADFVNSQKSPVPQYLYRYCSIDRLLGILDEKQIFIQTPAKMNDIFDFLPLYDFSISKGDVENILELLVNRGFIKLKDFDEMATWLKEGDDKETEMKMYYLVGGIFENLFNNNRESSKILCFTENYSNELLWAHYADSQKGVCIQFDTSIYDNFHKASIMKVKYEKAVPKLNIYAYFLNPIEYINSLVKSIITKGANWAYEEEWRLVLIDQFNTFANQNFINLLDGFVSSIILGINVDKQKKELLIKKVSDSKIKVFQCALNPIKERKLFFHELQTKSNEVIKIGEPTKNFLKEINIS